MNIHNNYCDNQSSTTNEEIENLTTNNKNKLQYNYNQKMNKKAGEIPQIKNFPQYFFVLFTIVLCLLIVKFVPSFYRFSVENPKLEAFFANKNKMKYFSAYLAELDIFSKILLLCSHLILYGIILSIKTCVDMRTTVSLNSFGYSANKFLIYPIIIISFFSINILMFNPEYIQNIFKNYTDNPIYFIYIFTQFIICLQINNNLAKIRNVAFSEYNNLRFGCIILNALQLLLYTTSTFLLTIIQGRTFLENLLVFILIICLNLNSLMFLITFNLYIYFLKNELDPMKLEIKFNYSEEYFIDLDVNNKNIL